MSISTHCLCNVDTRVYLHRILLSFDDRSRKLAQRGWVFVFVGRRIEVDKRMDTRRPAVALLMEDHKAGALVAVRASFHDFRSRHAEAVGEYHSAEEVALDIHDAACSPRRESMEARADVYLQGDKIAEFRQAIW